MWVRGKRVQGPRCPKSCSIHPIPQDNKDPCSIIMLCLSDSEIHLSSCLTPNFPGILEQVTGTDHAEGEVLLATGSEL